MKSKEEVLTFILEGRYTKLQEMVTRQESHIEIGVIKILTRVINLCFIMFMWLAYVS